MHLSIQLLCLTCLVFRKITEFLRSYAGELKTQLVYSALDLLFPAAIPLTFPFFKIQGAGVSFEKENDLIIQDSIATGTKLACVENSVSYLKAKWGKRDAIGSETLSTTWFSFSSGTLGSSPQGEDGVLLSSQSCQSRSCLPQVCSLNEFLGTSIVEVS